MYPKASAESTFGWQKVAPYVFCRVELGFGFLFRLGLCLGLLGAIIDCNQGKVTFNVNDKEHTVYFPKKIERSYELNSIINVETIQIGQIHLPLLIPKKEYHIVMIGAIPLKVEVI